LVQSEMACRLIPRPAQSSFGVSCTRWLCQHLGRERFGFWRRRWWLRLLLHFLKLHLKSDEDILLSRRFDVDLPPGDIKAKPATGSPLTRGHCNQNQRAQETNGVKHVSMLHRSSWVKYLAFLRRWHVIDFPNQREARIQNLQSERSSVRIEPTMFNPIGFEPESSHNWGNSKSSQMPIRV